MTHHTNSHKHIYRNGVDDIGDYQVCECGHKIRHTPDPTNSIDSELEFSVTQYRDDKNYESTQVTVNCKCGRGGWIRLQKHPDMSKYISRKEVEEAIADCEIDEGEVLIMQPNQKGKFVHKKVAWTDKLRAKLLPPTKGGSDE